MNGLDTLKFRVNGREVSVEPVPGEMLADLLRERLGLTGTKVACNEDECGACTVLVDGRPILSCRYPAQKVQGKEVLTIEGLAGAYRQEHGLQDDRALHPLQQAFMKYGAVQCGFCIPGQIMTSYALLRENPDPSEQEIKAALKDTLCRCAGYPSIIAAVQAAGRALRGDGAVGDPGVPDSARAGRVVGKSHARPDALAKVTGSARFTDDLSFEGMLHARVKRAMVPAGILRRVDVSRALALPGVRAVMTAEDLPGARTHGVSIRDWPILIGVGERVRYVGDAVALVAAETREIASQALDLIEVDIEEQAPLTDPVQALQPGAPALHPSGNLLKHIKVRKGDVEEGFAESDVVLEHTYHTPTYEHLFMEPECSVARPTPDGRMEVYVGSQIPYEDREQIADALGWPQEKVHVIGMLIGGGFGGKEDIAGQIHAALLAWKTGRPVKLLFDRHESILVHPKRHATQIRVKLGAKNDGRLVAAETELYGDTGAYASLGEAVMTRATTHSAGPYEIDHVKSDCYAVYTDNPPAGAFRGFGVLQAAFAIESLMDVLAEKLGIDPVALRRINALRVGSVTNTGQVLRQSVGLLECIDKVDAEMRRLAGDRNPFMPEEVPGKPHLRRSWGFAVGYKNTGLGGGAPDRATAEVELLPDGIFEARISSAELGQGLPAVLQAIAAEELGQDLDQVRVLLSDTDLTPDGGPTTASRQTYMSGNAVRHSADSLRDNIIADLAERYDVPPDEVQFRPGAILVGERKLSLQEVSALLRAGGRVPKLAYTYNAPATRPLGEGGDMHFAFSFAAQAAQVEVDTRTGEVRVLRLVSANDVGYAINPLGLRGQIEGGAMMGLGHTLTERFQLKDGRVLSDRMARYRMPSIELTPQFTSFVVEHPSEDGPFGAKGSGELVTIPTAPAIANAVAHAVGVRFDSLPIDQEHIALALEAA